MLRGSSSVATRPWQKGKDPPCRLLVELAQLAHGGAVKLYLPTSKP